MRFPVMAAAAVATLVAMAPVKAAEVAITLAIPVTGSATVNSNVMAYGCTDDQSVTATYINAGQVSLAVLDIAGTTVVASNVVAASGARYAGGRYVWWTRGEEADLFDMMAEGGGMICPLPIAQSSNDAARSGRLFCLAITWLI